MAAGATYDGKTVQQDGTPKGINLPRMGLQTKTAANPHMQIAGLHPVLT